MWLLLHSPFIKICLIIFPNLSVSIFLPVSLRLPLCPAHPVSLSFSCVFLCLGPGCSGDSPPLNSLTVPLVSVLSHPGRPQNGLLEKAHFVPDNDGAVPALCRGLLSKGRGDRGIWAVLWLRAAPQPWSLSSGLAFSS